MSNKELKTDKGQDLKEYLSYAFHDDITGHGTIRKYFDLKDYDINNEQEQEEDCLRYPSKLPKQIVDAIKSGQMSMIGIPANPSDLLNKKAVKIYRKKESEFYDQYEEADDIVMKYVKADTIYEKVRRDINMIQMDKCMKAFWELFKKKDNRQKAWQ